MMGSANTTRTTRLGSGRLTRLLFGIGCAALMLSWWSGCSVEKNYKLLSTFFDGVPDPNAPMRFDSRAIAMSSTYSEHRPFVDEACLECHKDPTDMLLAMDDSSMCMSCHSDIPNRYAYMHGAVTGNACLMCHNPHLSALPNLLRDDGPDMCMKCHEFDAQTLTPSHEDLSRKCLDCHSGHGGDVPFFLHSTPIAAQRKPPGEPENNQTEPEQPNSSAQPPEEVHGP